MFTVAALASAVGAADDCQTKLDAWCTNPSNCPLSSLQGDSHGNHCALNQKLYALFDFGGLPNQKKQKQWRCYASNNTDTTHEHYVDGRCYCSRQEELASELCKCDSTKCAPTPAPKPTPTPLPLENSTYTVFDSSISPEGSRKPVTCYRIPMIVQTPNALIAFAEGRLGRFKGSEFSPSCDDCVTNGIVQRRSTDGGRTWGKYTWAVPDQSTDPSRPNMDIGGNPAAVYDHATGKLILQFVRGLRNKKTEAQTCNPALTNWQIESSDDGQTWSKPVEISSYLGKWAGSLVGPANGIQLQKNAEHKNRLVWCGHWGVYNSTQVWYSDDGGATYTLSESVFELMDECAVAELGDGRVYLNMRNNHYKNYANGTSCDCRAYAVSTNGGKTFGAREFDPTLVSPVCQAVGATLSSAGGHLLFANPANPGNGFSHARNQGTIRKSLDMGKTWSRELHVTPVGLSVVDGGSYDYSCLVPEPLNDDKTKGGLLWSHNRGGIACSLNPAPNDCWLALFSRFDLGF